MVQERYVYSPFGQVTYYNCSSGSWVLATGSANKNTILFAGQSLNPTTGLNYDHGGVVQSGDRPAVPYARPDGLRRRRPEPLPLLRQQPDLRNRPDRAAGHLCKQPGQRAQDPPKWLLSLSGLLCQFPGRAGMGAQRGGGDRRRPAAGVGAVGQPDLEVGLAVGSFLRSRSILTARRRHKGREE